MTTKTITTDKQLIKALDKIAADNNTTDLTKSVIEMIKERYTKGQNECLCFMRNAYKHGCISGTVGELIYYSDTYKFFDTYSSDIFELLNDYKDETGEELQVKDTDRKNFYAWFGFEQTIYNLLGQLEIEF